MMPALSTTNLVPITIVYAIFYSIVCAIPYVTYYSIPSPLIFAIHYTIIHPIPMFLTPSRRIPYSAPAIPAPYRII